MVVGRLGRLGAGLGALAILGIAPLLLPGDWKNIAVGGILAVSVLYAFAVLSVVFLTGYVGQVSFCQATFMGISAFGTAALANHGVNYFVAAAVGVVLAFGLGIAVGLPALRLRGILLAIVTVGIALSFDYFFYLDPTFGWFNGGLSGWKVEEASVGPVAFNNLDFTHLILIYWVLLGLFAVVSVLVVNVHDSGSGRRFRAIRDSDVAASTMGVDLTRYKLLAFGISAAIAGVGGAFFPIVEGSVTKQPFDFFHSLSLAALAVLLGIRFIPAALLGGVFLQLLPYLIQKVEEALNHQEIGLTWFNAVLGALLVLQLILYPDGVWGENARIMQHALARFGPKSHEAKGAVTS
jgi:branched-chain amino acid transport system permease protein